MLSAGCLTPGSGLEQSPRTRQFLRVTKEVPAFGGVTRENDGWVVSVLDSEQRGTAEAKLRDIFGEEAATIAVRVRTPRGSASEQTMDAATEVLNVPGIERLDYDERTSYLRVGLVDVEAIEPAQLKLDELGIPLDQVILQVVSPIVAR
jgi:hypothetical protein